MNLRVVSSQGFTAGDLVTVKHMPPNERFCIIGIKNKQGIGRVAILKALFNETYIIEKPFSELQSLLIRGLL